MGSKPEYLILGEILRPHGVRGELKVRILTDYPERIGELEYVYLATKPDARKITRYPVKGMRMNQEYGLLSLQNVSDRSQADVLRNLLVMVHIEDAVPLEDGEIYLYELIGLEVRTEGDESLGKIKDVLETGANDVYVVDSPAFGEILIPITDDTLLETNVEGGYVLVALPDGLLPEK